MAREYTLGEMIDALQGYYEKKGFSVEPYSKRLYNIRIPLYCEKTKPKEQIVVDIITEKQISNAKYLPNRHFGDFMVRNASSVKFFQYYLPEAKIFWAYGHHVNDKEFKDFKKTCSENGIGLLYVEDAKITMVQDSIPLKNIIRKRIEEQLAKMGKSDESIERSISGIIAKHQLEYIQYLIFYGKPQFSRRAITDRQEDLSLFLSLLLINRLGNIKNISYAEQLQKFARDYRYESDNDHQIAFKLIRSLWKERLKIEYPDIHKDFEVVLLLDPYYRDHFLHQFQVFLLGAIIIDTLHSESWVKKFEKETNSKIEDAWLACSTYHDYNYPIQTWDDWMKRFLSQNFHVNDSTRKLHIDNADIKNEIMRLNLAEILIRDEFMVKLRRLSKGIECNCDDKFQRFIIRRIAIDKNHAALGAFTFLEIANPSTVLSDDAIDLAAGSIFLHDECNWQCLRGDKKALLECTRREDLSIEETEICNNPGSNNLELSTAPLTFLLIFCDVAQEWGRKGRNFEINKPRLEDLQIDAEHILVHVSVLDDSSYDQKVEESSRLGRYLKDARFGLKLSSREGKRESTIEMSGT